MMMSPSLLVSHGAPKPFQKLVPAKGPAMRAPVDLLNTAKQTFTHCTTWVSPTAALVSGGATVMPATLGQLRKEVFPTPSKLRPMVALMAGENNDCRALTPTVPWLC